MSATFKSYEEYVEQIHELAGELSNLCSIHDLLPSQTACAVMTALTDSLRQLDPEKNYLWDKASMKAFIEVAQHVITQARILPQTIAMWKEPVQ